MSLYSNGIRDDIISATVVPGVIDPSLHKLEDVAIPGGPRINMQDYAANPSEPVLTQQQVGVQLQHKPLLKLGDSLHFDNDKSVGKPQFLKNKAELTTIPQTTFSTQERFKRY